jgi:hypothetical protein
MVAPQPSVYVFGICIDEPIAMLTNIIVALVCFYAFYQMHKKKIPGRANLYFRLYFLLMGIATLLGGVIGHGFLYALRFEWKLPGWLIGMVAVGLIQHAAIAHARPIIKPHIGNYFLAFNLTELVTLMIATIVTLNFKWVELHSVYGLLAIVSTFHAYIYYRTKDKGSLTILVGLAITGIASLIFKNKISLHTWFNYQDISHLLLAIAAYVLYLGAIRLEKRDSKPFTLNLTFLKF